MKKKALLSSILTIVLCISLIAGSTFALFTSESTVNVAVTAGKVKVTASVGDLKTYSKNVLWSESAPYIFENGGTATLAEGQLTLGLITPGDKVTATINVNNESNVSAKYRTVIKATDDNGLLAGLKITINGTVADLNGKTIKTDWTNFGSTTTDVTIPVEIELPLDAGNAYQEKTCTLAFTVEAVQGNADMPDEWDGETSTPAAKSEDGYYHITNAAEFVDFINNYMTYAVADAREYVLDRDIDLCGYTIKTTAAQHNRTFDGIGFDGKNYTISNFTIDSTANPTGFYGGLFGYMAGSNTSYIKNLIVKNATIIGGKQTGVIIGGINGDKSTVENCKVYDCEIIGTNKVGAVVGYTASGIVKDCYAENCNVYCAENDANECGEVVGYINTTDAGAVDNTSNNTSSNVVVKRGVDLVISTAEELRAFAADVNNYTSYKGKTVVLVNDIDLDNIAWTPIGKVTKSQNNPYFQGTFDGMGHTISNLNVDKSTTSDELGCTTAGLFGWVDAAGAKIMNLNIDGATVKSNHYAGALVGYFTGVIDNCNVNNATVISTHVDNDNDGDKAGGLVGYMNLDAKVTNSSVSNSSIIANRDAGGLVGCTYNNTCTVEGNTVSNTTVMYSINSNNSGAIVGNPRGCNISDNTHKNVTVGEGVAVSTAADLTAAVAKNTATVNICLLNDITMPANWTPIDIGFYGNYKKVTNLTINGNGHTISGLESALVKNISANCSLTISNLTVKSATVNNSSYTNGMGNGILVGFVENGSVTLKNCNVVDSSITESSVAAAALIGYISNGTAIHITDCSVKNTVVNGGNAAGFVGYAQQANITVSGCKVTGSTFTGERTNKQGAYFGTVNKDTIANVSNTTADTTALVGRILSTGAVNYN